MSVSYYNDIHLKSSGPTIHEHGSHMIMTGVQQNLVERIVSVDTVYRASTNSDTILISEKIVGVKQMEVDSVDIPFTFYNITTLNNSFTVVKQSGSTLNLVLTAGHYSSINDVISAINTLLSATYGSGAVVFSIDPITKKTHINCTSNYSFTFTSTNSIAKILGFRSDLSFGSSFVSDSIALLHCPRHLYLTINEWSGQNINNFSVPTSKGLLNKNIIARITVPTGLSFGSIINASHSGGLLVSEVRHYAEKNNILRMEMTLIDENGVKIDLNGADFVANLRLLCE